MEGGAADRPAWLNMAVHVVNSLVAWLDLLIGELLGADRWAAGRLQGTSGCRAGQRVAAWAAEAVRLQNP